MEEQFCTILKTFSSYHTNNHYKSVKKVIASDVKLGFSKELSIELIWLIIDLGVF